MTQDKTQIGVAAQIERALRERFAPQALRVIDESHLHAGHAGARPEGESHFRVQIVSDAFSGQTRVARHRAVNTALAALLVQQIHALAIKAQTPEEAAPDEAAQ